MQGTRDIAAAALRAPACPQPTSPQHVRQEGAPADAHVAHTCAPSMPASQWRLLGCHFPFSSPGPAVAHSVLLYNISSAHSDPTNASPPPRQPPLTSRSALGTTASSGFSQRHSSRHRGPASICRHACAWQLSCAQSPASRTSPHGGHGDCYWIDLSPPAATPGGRRKAFAGRGCPSTTARPEVGAQNCGSGKGEEGDWPSACTTAVDCV